ncbi:hypothetical protein NtRootA2_41370 (plasmid) [Arthrobacter sp. NtRootA2]|nr:hypothetical protein NtRootA2_41370 [Arthrobacter sp. NtRootA2]
MNPETMANIGVVAGVLAVVVALATWLWQIKVQRNSGRKVSVRSTYIMPIFEDSEFHEDDFIQIEVMNQGGQPVTVTNYAVELNGRQKTENMWVLRPPLWATRLPSVVEPGGIPTKLLVPVSELRKAHRTKGIDFKRMVPWVELGDGRKLYSSNAVPLKA